MQKNKKYLCGADLQKTLAPQALAGRKPDVYWFPLARLILAYLQAVEVEITVPPALRPEKIYPANFEGVHLYLGQKGQAKKYPSIEILYSEEKGLGHAGGKVQEITFLFDVYTTNSEVDPTPGYEEHYITQQRLVTALYGFQSWFAKNASAEFGFGLELKISSLVSDADFMQAPSIASRIAVDCTIKGIMPRGNSVYKTN